MKASNATSAKATASPLPIGQSSVNPRPTPTSAKGFSLSGPSNDPDPAFHAYRQDLADVALAGRVIASHYAEPLLRHLVDEATLRHEPSEGSLALLKMASGDAFEMLDNSLGWAWGYAGTGRRVGYVKSEALGL